MHFALGFNDYVLKLKGQEIPSMKELIKLFCICLFVALVRTSIAFITIITLLENKHFINDDWSF